MSEHQLSLKSIFFPPELRLRKDYGAVQELAKSLAKYGQLQDILVRRPREQELAHMDGKEWIMLDGGRRYLAVALCTKAEIEIDGLEPGTIGVKFRDEEDELFALELEYHANEDRKNFNWKEKAEYVQRIHEGHVSADPEWSVKDTCDVLEIGERTVYAYLEFFKYPKIYSDERVQEADSFRTAVKQFKIVKSLKERAMIVEHREKKVEEKRVEAEIHPSVDRDSRVGEVQQDKEYESPLEFAKQLCQTGDARDLVKALPDSCLDFVHWDPPYGGEQSGGAFALYKDIDDKLQNAFDLLSDMIPELWRVLKPGRWMALWYHPALYHAVVREVEGSIEDERYRFWVNPYPNIWYKVDRKSDGHEIKRFLTNAYETFLWCCKVNVTSKDDPILVRNDRQNVFVFKQISKDKRRHVMHKPPELIQEIISCISLPGELGLDPSAGSFSSVEAGLINHRKVLGWDLDPEFVLTGTAAVEEAIEEHGVQYFNIQKELEQSVLATTDLQQ